MKRRYLPDTVVAIDLETTGVNPYRDRITEVGAVVWRDGEIVDRFCELVDPGTPLSASIVRLTGITPAMLKGKRTIEEVVPDFLDFLPEDCVGLAHNASFDASFLRRAAPGLFKLPMLDTLRLSGICFPTFASHSLEFLKGELGLAAGADSHRALADAECALRLWERMTTAFLGMPPALLKAIAQLLSPLRSDPMWRYFRDLAEEAQGDDRDLVDLFANRPAPKRRKLPETEFTPLPPEDIARLLGPDGPFARQFAGYEPRDEQVRMACAVQEALNDKAHLLVEAGTGVGKSFGYLLPALRWSLTNDVPVVVSTNTKNLQAQLFEKDIPALAEALDVEPKAALIKGRRNYLCLRKLLYLLRNSDTELERDERPAVASVLRWATETESGDISESVVGDRSRLRELASKLTSIAEECQGLDCPNLRQCFLQAARRKALSADLVVANHAVVMSELDAGDQRPPVLPPHAHIIFDEAHNMEDVATNALAHEVSLRRIGFVLHRLWRTGRGKKTRGIVPTLLRHLEKSVPDGDESWELALAFAKMVGRAIEHVQLPLSTFFTQLATFLKHGRPVAERRIRPERRLAEQWTGIFAAKETMLAALATVAQAADGLVEALENIEAEVEEGEEPPIPDLPVYSKEVRASALWLREFTEDVELVLKAENPEFVYWVESAPPAQGDARAWAAPIHVGELLNEKLFARKQTVVFTSATLSVGGSMDFLKGRLGAALVPPERLRELVLGTPFDYGRQCLVMVPTFLPEPAERDRDYATELARLLADVFQRTQGRGMALFTSHDMLRRAAGVLQHELSGSDIRVLAQGLSGSREKITRQFKRDLRSVLLGTHSFWEGVDVVGETLSCLVLARLPFAVFTDPVIEARCERLESEGQNPFINYSVPHAVIRFRQGFGRLIRHRNDRGVVIVADRRIVSKYYGQYFREAMPTELQVCHDPTTLLDEIEEFLG
jgi:predicted DnaQ family exonuclease/DinG family helicase